MGRIERLPHGVARLVGGPYRVLAIPDLHAPFQHPDAIRFLVDVKNMVKPDVVVCLGDEVDNAALSFHDKDPAMPSAKDEYHSALEFLGELYEKFPEVMVCESNHTARPFRMAAKFGLPSEYLKSYSEFLQAPPGWSWHTRILIDNVVYEHGDPYSGENAAKRAAFENRKSTVIGHIHGWGGVGYSASPFNQIFWANAGCLVDVNSLAFKYGSKYRNKATLGCVYVVDGKEAHFIKL